MMRVRAVVLSCALCAVPTGADGQVELCEQAERFVVDEIGMIAVTEPDTIDDWRTRKMTAGCRVTAADGTRDAASTVARGFYDRIREAGWVRTPEPRDAPGEASLRFRRDGADCLFNFYTPASPLNTEASEPFRSDEERR